MTSLRENIWQLITVNIETNFICADDHDTAIAKFKKAFDAAIDYHLPVKLLFNLPVEQALDVLEWDH